MLCPNCKTELVNINGRYICSDCGKEVPESEINIGDWGQGSFGGEKVIPEIGSVVATTDAESQVEPENFIVGETKVLTVDNKAPEIVDTSNLMASTTAPMETNNSDGFYVSENTPVTISQDAAIPVPVITKPDEQKAVDVAEVKQDSAKETETFGVKQDNESRPESPQQLAEDPDIYRDPISEDMIKESPIAEVSEKTATSGISIPRDKKVTITLISIGVTAAVVLVTVSLAFYFNTTKARVAETSEAQPLLIDCDKSEDKDACVAEKFKSCEVARWTGKFSDPKGNISELDYIILGLIDDKCEINLTATGAKNSGQEMGCAFPQNSDAAELKNISAGNCTGDLAKMLFGSIPNVVEADVPSPSITEDEVPKEDTGNLNDIEE